MYKLTPEQRAEVNELIDRGQEDLEGVLFELIYARDTYRQAWSLAKSCLLNCNSVDENFWEVRDAVNCYLNSKIRQEVVSLENKKDRLTS